MLSVSEQTATFVVSCFTIASSLTLLLLMGLSLRLSEYIFILVAEDVTFASFECTQIKKEEHIARVRKTVAQKVKNAHKIYVRDNGDDSCRHLHDDKWRLQRNNKDNNKMSEKEEKGSIQFTLFHFPVISSFGFFGILQACCRPFFFPSFQSSIFDCVDIQFCEKYFTVSTSGVH